MRMRSLALAAAIALIPAAAGAAKWIARPAESSIALGVSFEGVPVAARFDKWSADIDFDPADLAHSAATVRIDPGSFDSQSEERDEGVKEEDWFFVDKFPEARFVTKSIRTAGPGRYEAVGDLSIRGASREVTMPFTLVIDGTVARMDGAVTVDRASWGIGQGQWKSTDHVGASVAIKVHVVADRAH